MRNTPSSSCRRVSAGCGSSPPPSVPRAYPTPNPGLRGELNARMRPEIAELASGFLADLTDGRYDELELTEDYTLTILEGGVPKPVISGGEEDIASLVLRLAISQMIAERAGQPLS